MLLNAVCGSSQRRWGSRGRSHSRPSAAACPRLFPDPSSPSCSACAGGSLDTDHRRCDNRRHRACGHRCTVGRASSLPRASFRVRGEVWSCRSRWPHTRISDKEAPRGAGRIWLRTGPEGWSTPHPLAHGKACRRHVNTDPAWRMGSRQAAKIHVPNALAKAWRTTQTRLSEGIMSAPRERTHLTQVGSPTRPAMAAHRHRPGDLQLMIEDIH